MERIVVTDFNLTLNKKEVLNLIEGNNNEQIQLYYADIKKSAYALIKPSAVIAIGKIRPEHSQYLNTNAQVIYVITTIGSEISDKVSELFKQGRYLEAVLLNAMADTLLFRMEDTLLAMIKGICIKKGLGVRRRLEPATQLYIETQKIIWEETQAYKLLGINITETYMLNPVKSNTFVLETSDCMSGFNFKHDCSSCEKVECKMRKVEDVEIKFHTQEGVKVIKATKGLKLMQVLQKAAIEVPFICAGRGTCGKCGVKLINSSSAVTAADQNRFTGKELEKGYRLACQLVLEEDVEIELLEQQERKSAIVSEYKMNVVELNNPYSHDNEAYGVAIDIGTTTIAFELVSLSTGQSIQTYSGINKQRAFGADVVSRIEASMKGKGADLKRLIHKDIIDGLKKLCDKAHMSYDVIKKVVIAANTTMIHLMMGYDCSGLGSFPFKPVNINTISTTFIELFRSDIFECQVLVMPSVSAYVGADITAGMLTCDFDKSADIIMLIDIGTNGEMAIGSKDNILVTSVAAGPALEGGNISCGIGSIEGAISKVTIEKEHIDYETIAGKEPVGICGSAVIDITAQSLKAGYIDSTGLLQQEFFDSGVVIATTPHKTISFTQQDFRQVQLAKAAIVAGIKTLIKHYGCASEAIATVYIAGGFGYHIDIHSAATIGLIPVELIDKIKVIGNSALGGAKQFLLDDRSHQRINKILEITKELHLANASDFSQLYINHMGF